LTKKLQLSILAAFLAFSRIIASMNIDIKLVKNPVLVLVVLMLVMSGSLMCESVQAAGGPPMLTDDPGTPGDQHWEINIAALRERDAMSTTWQLPLVDINYGVGDRLQLKAEMPWLLQNGAAENHNGLGNFLLGVKWRFYDEGEAGLQVSSYPQLQFNLSNSSLKQGLTEGGTGYLLPFEMVRGFGDVDVNLEFGRWFRPHSELDSWIGGVVLTYAISKGVEVMAELHTENAVHAGQSERIANLGLRYDVNANNTLLLSIGRDLHNDLSSPVSVMTYMGLQMRL
jgi:hypothetical protein